MMHLVNFGLLLAVMFSGLMFGLFTKGRGNAVFFALVVGVIEAVIVSMIASALYQEPGFFVFPTCLVIHVVVAVGAPMLRSSSNATVGGFDHRVSRSGLHEGVHRVSQASHAAASGDDDTSAASLSLLAQVFNALTINSGGGVADTGQAGSATAVGMGDGAQIDCATANATVDIPACAAPDMSNIGQ